MLVDVCPVCNGTGHLLQDTCPLCDGLPSNIPAESSAATPHGLTISENVFTSEEQTNLVTWVQDQLELGRNGMLTGSVWTPVPKEYEHRGQSREMLQYGTYTHSNKVQLEMEIIELPAELRFVVDRLIEHGVISEEERLDSCTVNAYDTGQWIPPHIDNPLFQRPFCTVSLLSEQTMVMGKGTLWQDGTVISAADADDLRYCLKVGSVVRLADAAANEWEHAIPSVSAPRISLTFRALAPESPEREEVVAYCEAVRQRYRQRRSAFAVHEKKTKPEAAARAEHMAAKRIEKQNQSTRDAQQCNGGLTVSKKAEKKALKKADKKAANQDVCKARPGHTDLVGAVPPGSLSSSKTKVCAKCPEELISAYGNLSPDLGPIGKQRRSLPAVEVEYVQKVYNSVARDWHGTRYRTWSGVEAFIEKQGKSCLVADVGCGNGKNMPSVQLSGSAIIGSDFSAGLINICAERGLEVKLADALNLPYRSDLFDYALNIAVLHHISSRSRRIMLIEETMRVLRSGGVALFYAWAYEQSQGGVSGHVFEASDVLVPFHKKTNQGHGMLSMSHEANCNVHLDAGTTEHATIFQRYCHVFREGELEELVDGIPWCKVEAAYYDCGNWCIEVRKTEART